MDAVRPARKHRRRPAPQPVTTANRAAVAAGMACGDRTGGSHYIGRHRKAEEGTNP
jgi:hypothetical protein